MRAGKENNIKSRLDALNEIPDSFHFDEQAVWERLQARLKDQPQKRSYVWIYPVVGLCLLVLFLELGFFYVFIKNNAEGLLPATIVSKESLLRKPPLQKETPTQQEIIPIISSVDKKQSKILPKQKDTIIKDSSKIKDPVVQDVQLVKTDTSKTTPIETVQVTTPVTKRKFPIAHLNELPGEHPTIVVPDQGKTKTAFFKKKIPVMVYDPPPAEEERIFIRKKTRSLLNLKSSFQ